MTGAKTRRWGSTRRVVAWACLFSGALDLAAYLAGGERLYLWLFPHVWVLFGAGLFLGSGAALLYCSRPPTIRLSESDALLLRAGLSGKDGAA